MLLLLVPLLMFGVGLLLGGRPEYLLALPVRGPWTVAATFGAQWLLIHLAGSRPDPLLGAGFLASYALLLGFLVVNRALPGLKLALAGTALNLLVMAANGGFMPITPAALAAAHLAQPGLTSGAYVPRSKNIVLTDDQIRLGLLGDTLVQTWPLSQVYSAGDVLVALGVGTLVLGAMRPGRRGGRLRAADRVVDSTERAIT